MSSAEDRRVRNRKAMDRHMAAEYTNDIDTIMATISRPPRYALLRRGEPLVTFEDASGPRLLYTDWRSTYDCLESAEPKRIVTDWYVFQESVTRFRHKGQFDGVDRTGVVYTIPYAVFVPVREADRIVGEFVWGRRSVPDAIRAALAGDPLPSDTPDGTAAALRLHEQIIAALQDGAAGKLTDLFAPEAVLAGRDLDDPDGRFVVVEGSEGIADHYERLLDKTSTVEVVGLLATDWYVFAEHLWTLRSGQGTRRTASIFALDDDGRLVADVGFAADAG